MNTNKNNFKIQNIAIVGMNTIGKKHYDILKNMKGVNIVGLCDMNKSDKYKEPFYTDLILMLDEVKLDAVIIATPTFLDQSITLECANRNINMFIEKQAISNLEDIKKTLKIVNAKNIKSCVGYIQRFNPIVNSLINEIKKHEILSISITHSEAFPQKATDTGILTNLSVHDTDLIRFITKKEIVKSTVFKSQKIHNKHEDNAILVFELKDKVIGNITTNWLTPYTKRNIAVACRIDEQSKVKYFEADLISQTLKEKVNINPNSHITRNCFVKRTDALADELETFISYLNTGNRNSLASIEESIITLEIASN